jgi:hypothetical protein
MMSEKSRSSSEPSKKKTIDLLSLLTEFGSVSLEGVYIEKITIKKNERK